VAGKSKGRGNRFAFRFQLGWGGLAGVTLVLLCLLGWMFLMGVWAGQTILFPLPGQETKSVPSGTPPPAGQPGKPQAGETGKK